MSFNRNQLHETVFLLSLLAQKAGFIPLASSDCMNANPLDSSKS